MLTLLVAQDEIAEAQEQLWAVLEEEFSDVERRNITTPAGREVDQEVRTHGEYWCWRSYADGRNVTTPRFLNSFGILAPGDLRITVEVNVVPEGRNPRVAGFFAEDRATGALYLMHTGDVRGGVTGISGRAFRAWYGKPRYEVLTPEGRVIFGFIVFPVHALAPTPTLLRYVDSIDAFRHGVEDGMIPVDDPAFQHEMRVYDGFYKEPRGRRVGYHPGKIDYFSRHGDVVDALRDWREGHGVPADSRLFNDVFNDLGVANADGNLVELYEVKTSTERSDVYSAIGQLMVHAPVGCQQVIVVPSRQRLALDLAHALQARGIAVLRYTLTDHHVAIGATLPF